ncbi:MAG: BamA/TamA family outer membrane protein [Burkholderiaceae bacterium]
MPPTRPGPAPGCRSILSRLLETAACLAAVLAPLLLLPASALADASAEPRFDIEMQAPDGIRPFLLRHMDLQRFRLLDDLDEAELERLLARAPEDLKGLLGTLGHFSPQIQVTPASREGSTKAPLGVVRVSVDPGPPTRVASARVYLRGDIAANPDAAEQRARIERDVSLTVGETFTQADWEQVKTQALRDLTGERYPSGRLVNSLADIDAQKQEAHLHIDLDSGPARRLGHIEVRGAERYDPGQAQRLARLAGVVPGSRYSLENLQAAQARIAASERYASVLVTVEPDDDDGGENDLPVLVQVRERPDQKLQLGLGGSTDNGPRLSLEYRHLQVPGIGWQADNRIQLERHDKVAQSVWTAPMDEDAWRWAASARWAEQIDGVNTTTSQRLRWGRLTQEATQDQGRYLQFDRARTVTSTDRGEVRQEARSALSANQSWTWRRFSDPVFPERGQGLALELGVGVTLDGTSRPFARTQARWLVYWPLGGPLPTDPPAAGEARNLRQVIEQGRLGRLALRLEGGAVLARHDTAVPDTLLFLAGGDASVRGYGLREIGIERGDDDVAPGRYLAVGSIEWQRPIWQDGRRSPWEHVLFVDGGAVADRQQDLKAQWGVGTGVRYNSPVGPLQLDLAYGLARRAWRLHLSVGFAF